MLSKPPVDDHVLWCCGMDKERSSMYITINDGGMFTCVIHIAHFEILLIKYVMLLCASHHELRHFFISNDKKMLFDYFPDKAKDERFSNALVIVPLPKLKALTNSRISEFLRP